MKKMSYDRIGNTHIRENGKKQSKTIIRHKYYFYTLRHSYATYLRDKGVDIYTISDLLGHNQVTTTQIYARISDTQRTRAINEAFNHQFNPYQTPIAQVQQKPQTPSTQTENDKLLEIKKLELEIEKIKILKNDAAE